MRTITMTMPGSTTAAVDALLARLRREAGDAPNRFDFLEAVFSKALKAEIASENARLDALAAAAEQVVQEAQEAATVAPPSA